MKSAMRQTFGSTGGYPELGNQVLLLDGPRLAPQHRPDTIQVYHSQKMEAKPSTWLFPPIS